MRDGEKKYHKNSHKKQTNKGIYINKKNKLFMMKLTLTMMWLMFGPIESYSTCVAYTKTTIYYTVIDNG